MNRLRAICRAVADSPLLGVVLAVCFAVALGSAVAPAHPAHLQEASAGWAATPCLPRPLFLEAGLEAKLVGDSFDSHVPAMRSGLLWFGIQQIEEGCGREDRHRIGLPDFGPLYRRPPPSFS
ncbi:MAG: hypothetical protein LAQ69_25735 [Acidobacteriia bacterium]|nr:hypothetical protein [Terriglobia bacterium]